MDATLESSGSSQVVIMATSSTTRAKPELVRVTRKSNREASTSRAKATHPLSDIPVSIPSSPRPSGTVSVVRVPGETARNLPCPSNSLLLMAKNLFPMRKGDRLDQETCPSLKYLSILS
ncbi:hypothetical protein ACH5RR_022939 [Cinchona calisaya]|uniref:Uncharacterized protein n=1 Tax=Cinchona calisaya TaxID=153742 RepID=A0ABD2ZCE6_9GENT